MTLTTSAVPRRQPPQDVVCYDDLLQGILGKAAEARMASSRSPVGHQVEIPMEIPWKSTIETSRPKVLKS